VKNAKIGIVGFLQKSRKKIEINEKLVALTARLQAIDERLEQKTWQRDEYVKTIEETEEAYMKIVKSSQELLTVLKREKVSLSVKKKDTGDEASAPKREDTPSEETKASKEHAKEEKLVKETTTVSATNAEKSEQIGNSQQDADDEELRTMTLKAVGKLFS